MPLNIPDWEPEIECEIEAPWSSEPDVDWEARVSVALRGAHNVAPELANTRLCLSVLFTSDAKVQTLNKQWRGKDKPTNVLSFPMLTRDELLALGPSGPPVMLGDIALAWETCMLEAHEKGISLVPHVLHLLVHGLLHLAGYDHLDDAEADAMEAMEIKALALLGLDNPYLPTFRPFPEADTLH